MLSRFACTVLPLAKMASPVTSKELLGFVHTQCLGELAQEPAPAVIFQMLKMTLAFLSVVPLWGYTYVFMREKIIGTRKKYTRLFREKNGLLKDSVKFAGALLLIGGSCFVGIARVSMIQTQANYATDVLHKLFIEDVVAAGIFLLTAAITAFVFRITLYVGFVFSGR